MTNLNTLLPTLPINGPAKTRTVRTLIEKIDLSAAAGDFDFNSIPSGFDRLIISGYVRGDVTATSDTMYMFFNTDTTVTNYNVQMNAAADGAAVVVELNNARSAVVPAGSSPANKYSEVCIVIENPDGATNTKSATCYFVSRYDTDKIYAGQIALDSAVTAALTRIRLQTDNDPTDELFGILTLYGEKDEEIGGGNGFEDVNAQTGTTYEFVAQDLVDCVTANNASASTYDIPDDFGSVGSILNLLNIGAGQVTITVAGSDTLSSTSNKCDQHEAISILKSAAGVWRVIGGVA
jgi:hypothetical protein